MGFDGFFWLFTRLKSTEGHNHPTGCGVCTVFTCQQLACGTEAALALALVMVPTLRLHRYLCSVQVVVSYISIQSRVVPTGRLGQPHRFVVGNAWACMFRNAGRA
jgi:hypothetical protein